MAAPYILCYADAIQHGLDFLAVRGVDIKNAAMHNANVRRAAQNAYRELAGRRTWRYFVRLGQVNLVAAYETGTVAYDHTGGTYERQLTLTDGTWPTWTAYGTVRIGNVNYLVEDRKSSTIITLDAQTNPGADVASGTEFSIFRSAYTLPSDFLRLQGPSTENHFYGMCYVSPEEFLSCQRNEYSTGTPSYYTVARDLSLIGQLAIHVFPAPTSAEALQFAYYSRGREMKFSGFDPTYCKGEISTTADSTTVTGLGTNFTSAMIGSILRVGDDPQTLPTGLDGHNPRIDERTIMAVASTTSLTVDAGVASTQTKVKYSISDVVDLEPGMVPCYLRCIEKHLALFYGVKGNEQIRAAYEEALILAKEEDNRTLDMRSPMDEPGGYPSYEVIRE